MPKTKRKAVRAQQAAALTSNTQPVKAWVKWVALGIVAALGVSIIAGAITATPAHASTSAVYTETSTDPASDPTSDSTTEPTPEPVDGATLYSVDDATPGTCLLDTDQDGIANPDDPDIDGDGMINAEDSDIDSDGLANTQDGDPAATNCNDNAEPPIMAYSTTPAPADESGSWGLWVTFGSAFALVAVVVIVLVSKRTKKG
jgi:hypothetical protein